MEITDEQLARLKAAHEECRWIADEGPEDVACQSSELSFLLGFIEDVIEEAEIERGIRERPRELTPQEHRSELIKMLVMSGASREEITKILRQTPLDVAPQDRPQA